MEQFLDQMGKWAAFAEKMNEFVDTLDETSDETGELVELYVYDLSQSSEASSRKSSCSSGAAGFSIVYHTSIVAFGNEYTFNCTKGIAVAPVNREEEKPEKTHVLGRTKKTKNELKKFLEDLANRFKARNYDILKLNCQVFCSELCKFLEVEGLPGYITKIREFVRDIFGSQRNLEIAGDVAVGLAVAGIGYTAYKAFSKNDNKKN